MQLIRAASDQLSVVTGAAEAAHTTDKPYDQKGGAAGDFLIDAGSLAMCWRFLLQVRSIVSPVCSEGCTKYGSLRSVHCLHIPQQAYTHSNGYLCHKVEHTCDCILLLMHPLVGPFSYHVMLWSNSVV